MHEFMLFGMSSSVAPLGRGTKRSCSSSFPILYGARLTTAVLPRLLLTLDAKPASSVAHSLKQATSAMYGRPKHLDSCSLRHTYERAKLPSSATRGERSSYAEGGAFIRRVCMSLC